MRTRTSGGETAHGPVRGTAGPAGQKGPTGAAGAKGRDGASGATGAKGSQRRERVPWCAGFPAGRRMLGPERQRG